MSGDLISSQVEDTSWDTMLSLIKMTMFAEPILDTG